MQWKIKEDCECTFPCLHVVRGGAGGAWARPQKLLLSLRVEQGERLKAPGLVFLASQVRAVNRVGSMAGSMWLLSQPTKAFPDPPPPRAVLVHSILSLHES